jgi:hypothetical protein
MCIAVIIPAGLAIHKDIVFACSDKQRNGMGFAFVGKKEKVEVYKRPDSNDKKSVSEFFNQYITAWNKGGKAHPFLMHFRSATSGEVSKDNSHPFILPTGGALMHNGFFYDTGKHSKLSDTHDFVVRYGKALTKDFVTKNKADLELVVGSWNKLAFLWGDGSTSVLNEKEWDRSSDGLLFSNKMWRNA